MFDRIAFINLDKRKDRLGAFKAKIASYPTLQNYTRYRAVHGDTVTVPGFFCSGGGAYGCRQSHLRVLEDAMMDGIQTLLVLEDDVKFVPNFEAKLNAFMRIVPSDWEGLMLGGQDHMPGPTSTGIDGVLRSINTQRTHAYVVRGLEPMRDLYRLWARCDRHIDHWFDKWQIKHAVYQPQPYLCGQDETNSDITGRDNGVRYWNLPTPEAKTHPLYVMQCDRSTVETLCNFGLHIGYDRDSITGLDRGLAMAAEMGWPSNQLLDWVDVVVHEALERYGVPGIWFPAMPDLDTLEQRLGREVRVLKISTVEEGIKQLPKLQEPWKASKIVWCWRGEGYEVLEGLNYHGWHRGFWKDEVTGLDNGIRRAVEQDNYGLIKQIVRQLDREIFKIRNGRILLAHPQLNIEKVRNELPGQEVHEMVGDCANDLMIHADKIVKEALEMYNATGTPL